MSKITANDHSAVTTGNVSPISQESQKVKINYIKKKSFLIGFISGIFTSILGSAIWNLFLSKLF